MASDSRSNVKRFSRIPRLQRDTDAGDPDAPVPACSFCGRPLTEVGFLVGSGAAKICEYCVDACSSLVRRPPGSREH